MIKYTDEFTLGYTKIKKEEKILILDILSLFSLIVFTFRDIRTLEQLYNIDWV